MFQNGAEASGQSDPTADSSPGNSISDAENFECYGEGDHDAPANTLVSTRIGYEDLNEVDHVGAMTDSGKRLGQLIMIGLFGYRERNKYKIYSESYAFE